MTTCNGCGDWTKLTHKQCEIDSWRHYLLQLCVDRKHLSITAEWGGWEECWMTWDVEMLLKVTETRGTNDDGLTSLVAPHSGQHCKKKTSFKNRSERVLWTISSSVANMLQYNSVYHFKPLLAVCRWVTSKVSSLGSWNSDTVLRFAFVKKLI